MAEKLEALQRAYRLAYAPLRSAQHALDIIARNTTGSAETRTLAREESKRIEQAIDALTATPDRSDDALAEESRELTAEVERLRGLLVDPGSPPWEDARAILVAELRKIGFDTHADNVAAGEGVMLPSYVALNLIAHCRLATIERCNSWMRALRNALDDSEEMADGTALLDVEHAAKLNAAVDAWDALPETQVSNPDVARLREALIFIQAAETKWANATVRRMANAARAALKGDGL